jgi:predicted RNase H-like nuclease (RuvC/YqgF family)
LPFKLPANIATKQDIDVLRGAVTKINTEIKAVADANNNNAQALTKLTKQVSEIDGKHIAATKEQNKYISKMGRVIDKLGKDLRDTKQQAQMQMMFSLLMPPRLSNITFENDPTAGTPVNVTDSKFAGNNEMMMMMMAMGGLGSDSGDVNSNPMLMFAMMNAFK